jgi:hypothetical protein
VPEDEAVEVDDAEPDDREPAWPDTPERAEAEREEPAAAPAEPERDEVVREGLVEAGVVRPERGDFAAVEAGPGVVEAGSDALSAGMRGLPASRPWGGPGFETS